MGICTSNEATQVRVISANVVSHGVFGVAGGTLVDSVGSVNPTAAPPASSSSHPIGAPSNEVPLRKRDSDMNLIPQDLQTQWFDSDESKFDREKTMLVLCPNVDATRPSKVLIIDADYMSKNYMQVISELEMPKPGDDFIFSSWSKIAASNAEVNAVTRRMLVIPCVNTSRIYVVAIDEFLHLHVYKCLSSEELARWDITYPLAVCNSPGRGTPLVVCSMGDRFGNAKGDLLRLDRQFFEPIERRTSTQTIVIADNCWDTEVNASPSQSQSGSNAALPQFAQYGGSVALLVKHGLVFSTEWAAPSALYNAFRSTRLQREPPSAVSSGRRSARKVETTKSAYVHDDEFGRSINVWNVQSRRLLQTLKLDDDDGRLTICVRMLHHRELTHGFVCTALGGCVYHMHRNTRTGRFSAHRVIKFAPVLVDGWMETQVPAFPVDMVVSMDDEYLYVACWLQGFIAQYDVSDPFRPTSFNRIFMGGVIHKSLGVRLNIIASMGFAPQRRTVAGVNFEGGPARMQLSLDGRRLYVTNSFFRPWDEHFFPDLVKKGSTIAIVHIDLSNNNNRSVMLSFDENFGFNLSDKGTTRRTDADGGEAYLAREMRFLNGDSTSDSF